TGVQTCALPIYRLGQTKFVAGGRCFVRTGRERNIVNALILCAIARKLVTCDKRVLGVYRKVDARSKTEPACRNSDLLIELDWIKVCIKYDGVDDRVIVLV